MKKIFLVIFVIIIVATIYIISFEQDEHLVDDQRIWPSPTPNIAHAPISKVDYNGKTYAYSVFKITDLKKIELISNLKNKVSAGSLLDNKCKYLINAGFYGKNNKHLGLFAFKNEIISKPLESNLFNGYLSLNLSYKPIISQEIPEGSYIFALQSGPILVENENLWTLKVLNDENERRVFAGITNDFSLYFGVVYQDEDNYAGAYLNDLPKIVKLIFETERLTLQSAINLDGGSASVFYTDKIKLSELTTVGGFFCIK